MISLIVTVALLFLAGYAAQRSSVCAVAALSVMALDERAGNTAFSHFPGAKPGVPTVVGALLFGIGAWSQKRGMPDEQQTNEQPYALQKGGFGWRINLPN